MTYVGLIQSYRLLKSHHILKPNQKMTYNKSLPYFFFYFDNLLLSSVRHNSKDKICCYFHFIVIKK